MQLTIREMKEQATSPKFWAGLLCVVCILTVTAPFSTDKRFNTIQLFFYWGGIALSTHFCSDFILRMVLRTLKAAGKSEMKARVIGSLAAAFAVVIVVLFINTVVVGTDQSNWQAFVILGIKCAFIALAISTIFFIVSDTLGQVETSDEEVKDTNEYSEVTVLNSLFYERLTKPLGTDVISLQAQDHYVDVRTTLGNELVLIRLSDAIKELGEDSGIQVHRSWWVTHKHMVEQKRINGKLHLVLSDGSVAPISRTYGSGVKTALTKPLHPYRNEN